MKKTIEEIARIDGRYSPSAIHFIYEGLGYAVRNNIQQTVEDKTPKHVSGQELSMGIGELARQKWGLLAKMVFNSWGVSKTRDFGEIVYMMIEHKWMSTQPEDKIEDFDNVYDFEQFFNKEYKFEINTDKSVKQ